MGNISVKTGAFKMLLFFITERSLFMKKIITLITVLGIATALTGCGRIKSEIKDELDYNEVTQQTTTNLKISQAEAETIALEHAGLSAESVSGLHTEYDYDDGRYEYDVDFYANGFEYSYEIDAITKEILKSEKDTD